jgi:hypothetical protein
VNFNGMRAEGKSYKLKSLLVKKEMPKPLKRYWHKQDMGQMAVGVLIGGFLMGIIWLISL